MHWRFSLVQQTLKASELQEAAGWRRRVDNYFNSPIVREVSFLSEGVSWVLAFTAPAPINIDSLSNTTCEKLKD